MKRFTALALASAMLLTVLAGCSNNQTSPTNAPPVTELVTELPATGSPDETEPPVTGAPAETAAAGTELPATGVPATEQPTAEDMVTDEPAATATPDPSGETPAPTGDQTALPSEQPTATTAPTATTKPTATTVPESEKGPTSAIRVTFNTSKAATYFSGGNFVKAESVTDSDYGRAMKLVTTQASNDPFISFNYENYMKAFGLTPASADTYKYVVLKVKQNGCSNSSAEMFYFAGSIYGATGGYSKTATFDNFDTEWQYIVYDLSSANGWKGTVHGFRFDYMFTAAGAGESLTLGEIIFAKTIDDVSSFIGGSSEDKHALSAADQKKAEQLISGAKDVAPAVSNSKLTAANEDPAISLWFNHPYVKTPEESTASSGLNTYQIRMAKNEIEGVQLLLASTAAKSGLTIELTDITNGSAKLKYVICEGHYFNDVEGQSIVDPIPELKGAFALKANRSKTFLIKVYTDGNTAAGQYSAVVRVKDSSGKEIKKANLYVYVWNFALPLASNCKIQADLSWYNLYATNPPWLYNGDDSRTYVRYYDYLLENKVNCYRLPYMDDSAGANPFPDSRVQKYLNDPRVQCFNPVSYGYEKANETRILGAYNYLKNNPEWLAKAYFYPVDEPVYRRRINTEHTLDELIEKGNLIKSIFGSQYKLIAPIHINQALNNSTADCFSYVSGVVNVWCPHTYFFNTLDDFKANPKLMFQYYTAALERNLGSFVDRMAAEQAGGDEVWWYVTRFPHNPEITLSIDDQEVVHRILFWQQKLYNVDGFLYYMVNDWFSAEYPWSSKHERDNSYPFNVYGNGVLVYNGFEDSEGQFYSGRDRYNELSDKSYNAYPVGSLRLESVRDGAEDYDYLTILDELYGEGTSDLIIKQITTSLGNYKDDAELFNRLRIAVGNLIAARS